jgi:hypothetical protein
MLALPVADRVNHDDASRSLSGGRLLDGAGGMQRETVRVNSEAELREGLSRRGGEALLHLREYRRGERGLARETSSEFALARAGEMSPGRGVILGFEGLQEGSGCEGGGVGVESGGRRADAREDALVFAHQGVELGVLSARSEEKGSRDEQA